MRVLSLLILFFIGSHLSFGQKTKENRKPEQPSVDSTQTVTNDCDSLKKLLDGTRDSLRQSREESAGWFKKYNVAGDSLESQKNAMQAELNASKKIFNDILKSRTNEIDSIQNANASLDRERQAAIAAQDILRQKIKEQEEEIARLKNSESGLKANLQEFRAIAAELTDDLKRSASALLVSGNPADPASAPKAEEYISKASKLSDLAPPTSQKDLQDLTQRLEEFKNAALAFSEAMQILQNDYDQTAVSGSIRKLNAIGGLKNNEHFAIEKQNVLYLLQNYCLAYRETFSYFQLCISQDLTLKEDDFNTIEKYIFKKISPPIAIVASYPYIKTRIEELKATCKKSNWTYKLKANIFREITCPNPK